MITACPLNDPPCLRHAMKLADIEIQPLIHRCSIRFTKWKDLQGDWKRNLFTSENWKGHNCLKNALQRAFYFTAFHSITKRYAGHSLHQRMVVNKWYPGFDRAKHG